MTYVKGKVYHILICEDNLVNLQINKKYIELFSDEMYREIEIHDYSSIQDEIYDYMNQIDVAILDIDLQGESGLQLAKTLQEKNPKIPIIFITSFAQYREEASTILAVGLLQKPVDPEKFRLLYQRSLAQLEMESQKEAQHFLELVINKREIKIKMMSIVSLEKIQKKVRLKTDIGIYEVRDTLTRLEQELLPCFLRISQSVIVNMNEIICIEGNEVFLTTRDTFNVGRTYQKRVETTYRRYWK